MNLMKCLVAAFLVWVSVGTAFSKIYIYSNDKDEKLYYELNVVTNSTDDSFVISISNSEVYRTVLSDKDTNFIEWNMGSDYLSYQGYIKNDKMYINGKNPKGKEIKIEKKIDGYVWYPEWSFMFNPFLIKDKNKEKEVFWTIDPKDGSAYKMQMVKDKEEKIELYGKTYDAMRIKITAYGIPEIFYKDYYWVDKEGIILKGNMIDGKGKFIGEYSLYEVK